MHMDVIEISKGLTPITITDPKTVVPVITEHLIASGRIRFCNREAFIKGDDHYIRGTDDDLIDIIKECVGRDMALRLPESVFETVVRKLKSVPELRIDWLEENAKHRYEINMKNGVFQIMERKLTPNPRDRPFTYVLNANYIPNSKLEQAPCFRHYIKTSVGEENYDCLMRIIGYVLSSLIKGRKAFVLIGKGGTGKSTLLDLLEAIVTEEFVSREPFHTMGSPNSIARYVDKKINISRENGVTPMRNEDGFKSLVSCEGITGRDVYSKAVSFVPTLKFIFGSNHDLCFAHPDDAVYDRLVVILFTREIAQRDLNLDAKLFKERDIIVSLALDSLKDLVTSGYDFKESEMSRRYIKTKRMELHTAESFLDECCIMEAKASVSRKELYRAYEIWAERNSVSAIGRNSFFDRVRRWNHHILDRKVSKDGERSYGFVGIKLLNGSEYTVETEENNDKNNVAREGQVSGA